MTQRVGTDKRKVLIKGLEGLLDEIIAAPERYCDDEVIKAGLHSQGALSKLSNSEKGIYPTSLNTIKRISLDHADGGFDGLNRRRIKALDAVCSALVARQSEVKKDSKEALKQKVDKLEDELQKSLQDCLRLTDALNKSMAQARNYVGESKLSWLIELCRKDQHELRLSISLGGMKPNKN